jgi:hypothetical protein
VTVEQITVFLENEAGRLAEVAEIHRTARCQKHFTHDPWLRHVRARAFMPQVIMGVAQAQLGLEASGECPHGLQGAAGLSRALSRCAAVSR